MEFLNSTSTPFFKKNLALFDETKTLQIFWYQKNQSLTLTLPPLKKYKHLKSNILVALQAQRLWCINAMRHWMWHWLVMVPLVGADGPDTTTTTTPYFLERAPCQSEISRLQICPRDTFSQTSRYRWYPSWI